jgi:hypothetical protein
VELQPVVEQQERGTDFGKDQQQVDQRKIFRLEQDILVAVAFPTDLEGVALQERETADSPKRLRPHKDSIAAAQQPLGFAGHKLVKQFVAQVVQVLQDILSAVHIAAVEVGTQKILLAFRTNRRNLL